MSFSSNCKQELCRIIPGRKCCRIAELSAIIKTTGTLQISKGRVALKLEIENAAIARKVFMILKKLFNISVELNVRKNYYFKKHNTYMLLITEDMGLMDILSSTKILSGQDQFTFNHGIDKDMVKSQCCRRAYLRGAFLGSASISDPEKTYHLEFVTDNEQFAKDLENIINTYKLNSKIVQRKNYFVVYLKEGENIIDLLNIIGAHTSLLELENIRVYKEMRNNVNRIVNCETANLQKTVDASMKQIDNIKLIEETIGIDKLPKNLRDIARLRLEFSEASLKELGEMLYPSVSKSGVNHRLRKIDDIAQNIKLGGNFND